MNVHTTSTVGCSTTTSCSCQPRSNETVANLICAQILYLESADPERDISLYINSPGGDVIGLMAIYDTMSFVRNDVSTICLGQAASAAAVLLAAGAPGKALCAAELPDPSAPTVVRRQRSGVGHRDSSPGNRSASIGHRIDSEPAYGSGR